MKFLIVLAFCVAITVAAPPNPSDVQATIVHEVNDIDPQGNFHNAVQTSNGISSQSQGVLKANPDPKEPPFVAVSGQYEYPNPEGGAPIKVTYTADEYGFHAEGVHLPVASVA